MSGKSRDRTSLDAMVHRHHAASFVGDGAKVLFPLPVTVSRADDLKVYVSGLLLTVADRGTANDYAIVGGNTVVFTAAPGGGAPITFDCAGG